MQHTISVLVENQSGVLARVAGLFSSKAFNIDSLAVGETEDSTISRMTIVARGDERTLEQIIKQLNRLVDVIRVRDISKEPFIDRESCLIRVEVSARNREEVVRIVENLHAQVVDAHDDTVIVQATGDQAQIHTLLELMKPFGVREVVRTGRIAISRALEVTARDLSG
jgi:acetolactate synthase I/III small subunit